MFLERLVGEGYLACFCGRVAWLCGRFLERQAEITVDIGKSSTWAIFRQLTPWDRRRTASSRRKTRLAEEKAAVPAEVPTLEAGVVANSDGVPTKVPTVDRIN